MNDRKRGRPELIARTVLNESGGIGIKVEYRALACSENRCGAMLVYRTAEGFLNCHCFCLLLIILADEFEGAKI